VYSGVINHPTAPLEVKRQFRASELSSALNVMRTAIQGEPRLKSMPNNTIIMICFAACIALNLSTPTTGGGYSLAPSVRNLIEETAAVLERIGSAPAHRNGMSVLYGKYLRELVKQAPAIVQPPQPMVAGPATLPTYQDHTFQAGPAQVQTFAQQQYPLSDTWLQFSAMSGNEVIETVLNAADQESALWDFPINDANAFTWMDWMNPPDWGVQ
jgi:hypothetical protein